MSLLSFRRSEQEKGPYPFSSFVEEIRMHAPIKYFEKGLSITANGDWLVFNTLN